MYIYLVKFVYRKLKVFFEVRKKNTALTCSWKVVSSDSKKFFKQKYYVSNIICKRKKDFIISEFH